MLRTNRSARYAAWESERVACCHGVNGQPWLPWCVSFYCLPEGCPRPPTLRRPLPHRSCVPTPGRVAAYPGRHGRAVAARPAPLLPPKVLVDGRLLSAKQLVGRAQRTRLLLVHTPVTC